MGMHTPGIVTRQELSRGLVERLGIAPEAADEQAEYLLDLFGFDPQIIDNILEPEDRQIFYALQQAGFLTTKSEETPLWNGQEWRTHYWVMKVDKILEAAHGSSAAVVAPPEAGVYEGLPADVWARR